MGLFYAYVKYSRDNDTYRYVMTFASREIADEWWRAFSKTSYANSVKRVTPEFYTHDVAVFNLTDSVLRQDCTPQFLNKVFFTLLMDRGGRDVNHLPLQNITDHVSGNLFFIRSKADPTQFWYCPNSSETPLCLSRTDRTLFRIDIANAAAGEGRGTVMISTDDITITAVSSGKDLPVSVGDSGVVIAGDKLERFKFGDFKGGFRVGKAYDLTDKKEVRALIRTEEGENWELVN
ncbi:hypothetical protein GLOTRDRAFT_110634 [Gloeophyllum trabeum ATCC 11539]|uniref:Uncharacterized protein n=1 Tax=Gloeophyllum trabeum (strain ATCC 11539 / FP-39264 / Madison 617) TaxID=670483 RepID=S7QE64_GLOTA|nr:uncharacterized protein GLOTRDRAFT_110634 [Gloeophyllum trabeum ATCC 11539]EPQ57583.1 hypothetical protein GLOTRDRAFT_110634 [Gloeophyllum trabeum ATCC 11539]